MGAPSETEVKLRIRDRERLRSRLRELGATLVRERYLEDDALFDDAAGSLRARRSVLRVRRTPHGGALTFKGPRLVHAGLKTREERETAVADPGVLEAILGRLGYRCVFRYQKYRESWLWRDQKVELDETPIGDFVEIEGDPERIAAVAAELGYRPDEYLSESYFGLFRAGGGSGDMVFEPPPGGAAPR